MFSELVKAGSSLAATGEMVHPGYRVFSDANSIKWILHVESDGKLTSHPERVNLKKPRPDRHRSGKLGTKNLKPYLLADEARYVLGIPEPGKEQEAELLHGAFMDLLEQVYEATQAPYIVPILEFLRHHLDRAALALEIAPRDVVTFKVGEIPYPFERQEMQEFWAAHIGDECCSDFHGQCSVCGRHRGLVQTLPKSVFVLNQSCQLSSFNKSAFRSFGKEQTVNANICIACGLLGTQALEHLLASDRHSAVLAKDGTKSRKPNPLRNQVAVFWLTEDVESFSFEGSEISPLEIMASPLSDRLDAETMTTLELIQDGMKAAWSGQVPATLRFGTFCLAVVSANKARLVLREWIKLPMESSLSNAWKYVQALQVIGPKGTDTRAFPIGEMMETLRVSSPNLLRGLLRTAYAGHPVPPGVLEAAVRRVRIVAHQGSNKPRKAESFHIIVSAAKLAMTYGTKEAEILERLDVTRDTPGYLCGRILAILEEAQTRAARFRLNATLVERFFGSASTSPVTVLPGLVKMAETAYLPKIRKENLGYAKVRALLQETCAKLGEEFPSTLTLKEQGEFMLGFYHQRVSFEAERAQARALAEGTV